MNNNILVDLNCLISINYLDYESWNEISKIEHIYFGKEVYSNLIKYSDKTSLEYLLEKSDSIYSDYEKEEIINKKNHIFEKLVLKNKTNINKELLEYMYLLEQKGYNVTVISTINNASNILNILGIKTKLINLVVDNYFYNKLETKYYFDKGFNNILVFDNNVYDLYRIKHNKIIKSELNSIDKVEEYIN